MDLTDLDGDALKGTTDKMAEKEPLPILPGMCDAENQTLRFDLPSELMAKLRNWD